jgi:hypothetical protein
MERLICVVDVYYLVINNSWYKCQKVYKSHHKSYYLANKTLQKLLLIGQESKYRLYEINGKVTK